MTRHNFFGEVPISCPILVGIALLRHREPIGILDVVNIARLALAYSAPHDRAFLPAFRPGAVEKLHELPPVPHEARP
jgi:hypothetical protein